MAKKVVREKEITGKRSSKSGVKTKKSTGVHGGKRTKTTTHHSRTKSNNDNTSNAEKNNRQERLPPKTINRTVKRKGENRTRDKDITKTYSEKAATKTNRTSKEGHKKVTSKIATGGTKVKNVEYRKKKDQGDGYGEKKKTITRTNSKGRVRTKVKGSSGKVSRSVKHTGNKKSSNRGTGNK